MTINLTEWLPYFLPHNTTSITNSNTECTNSPSLTVSRLPVTWKSISA